MPQGANRQSISDALLVGLFALTVRLLYLISSSLNNPAYDLPVVDALAYYTFAGKFLGGQSLVPADLWQPIFYKFYLVAAQWLLGDSIGILKTVQAILGSLSCVVLYLLGRRWFSRKVGILAAAIYSLYGPAIFFEQELLATGWAVFFSLLLLYLIALGRFPSSAPNNPIRYGLLYFSIGACAALAILTRPVFAAFIVPATLWFLGRLLIRARNLKMIELKPVGLGAMGFLIFFSPWLITAYQVTDKLVLSPSSGGINFYIGNNADRCTTLTLRPGPQWNALKNMPGREARKFDPWEQSDFFYAKSVDYITEHPGSFLAGLAGKAVRLISSREIPRNSDLYLQREYSYLLQGLVWKTGLFGFPFGILFALALAGFIGRAKQVPKVLWLWMLSYSCVLILFFVSARYRLPLIPALCLGAALGIDLWHRALRRLKNHRSDQELDHQSAHHLDPQPALQSEPLSNRWPRLIYLAAVSVLGIFITLPGPFCEETGVHRAEFFRMQGLSAFVLEKNQVALEHLATARRLDPDNHYILSRQALVQYKLGAKDLANQLCRSYVSHNMASADQTKVPSVESLSEHDLFKQCFGLYWFTLNKSAIKANLLKKQKDTPKNSKKNPLSVE